jgi:hypothetical protein
MVRRVARRRVRLLKEKKAEKGDCYDLLLHHALLTAAKFIGVQELA